MSVVTDRLMTPPSPCDGDTSPAKLGREVPEPSPPNPIDVTAALIWRMLAVRCWVEMWEPGIWQRSRRDRLFPPQALLYDA
jgi:hypothetical protein